MTRVDTNLPASLAASLLNSQRWRQVAPFARSVSDRVRNAVAAFGARVPDGAWEPAALVDEPLTRVYSTTRFSE